MLPQPGAALISTVSAAGAYNSSKNGGGVGANGRVSMFNKHVDLGSSMPSTGMGQADTPHQDCRTPRSIRTARWPRCGPTRV